MHYFHEVGKEGHPICQKAVLPALSDKIGPSIKLGHFGAANQGFKTYRYASCVYYLTMTAPDILAIGSRGKDLNRRDRSAT